MDKFIVRTPRGPKEERIEKPRKPKLKQITIKSLPRVVVVEDIQHLKSLLEVHKDDTTQDKLVEILEKLKSMNPSTKVLKDTKIGRSVNKFKKCKHQSVSELSRVIVRKWKKLVVEENTRKESIDVRCDAKSELLRSKARKLIANSFSVKLPDPWTEILEKRLFEKCERRVDNRYKRSVRSIVFLIKQDKSMGENVKKGIAPDEIIAKCLHVESKK